METKNETNFNIGDLVEHKADNRQMVVVDYGKPDTDPRWDAKDVNKPICRFFQDSTQTYISQQFVTSELRRIDE